jgi:ribosomal protein L11 methyltransferase
VVAGQYLQPLTQSLQDLAPGGLTVEEPYVPLGPEEGARLEPWRPTVVRLYLPDNERLAEQRRRIDDALRALLFEVEVSERRVQEEDWAESWKEFFQVERVGRRLVIRPTWRDYQPKADEVVLDLDPGMAFGTGQHPTTRLCLRAVEELAAPGMRMLDLGCGSGILSLAAAKLGCASVVSLDIEPIAIETTRANARLNGVEATVQAAVGSLGDSWPLAAGQLNAFDTVVANISAGVLVSLAAELAAALRPGGTLVGSGVVAERADEVLLALAAAGLRIERLESEAGWRAAIARK